MRKAHELLAEIMTHRDSVVRCVLDGKASEAMKNDKAVDDKLRELRTELFRIERMAAVGSHQRKRAVASAN